MYDRPYRAFEPEPGLGVVRQVNPYKLRFGETLESQKFWVFLCGLAGSLTPQSYMPIWV